MILLAFYVTLARIKHYKDALSYSTNITFVKFH